MSMLERFVNRTAFASYEDFRDHLEIRVPENFNFAYDVVDVYAQAEPARRAMVWCNDEGAEKIVTFADLKAGSDRAAQVFQQHGIRKGDAVLLILKGRLEFWHCLMGLHKLGAVGVARSGRREGEEAADAGVGVGGRVERALEPERSRVVGEDVDEELENLEEEAQAVTLQELGVQVGQGMLFGKGLPADEAARLIRERRVFR